MGQLSFLSVDLCSFRVVNWFCRSIVGFLVLPVAKMGKLPSVVSIDAMLVMDVLLIISQEHFFSFIEYILFGKYWSNSLRYKCLLGHSLAKKIGRGVSHQASAKFSCNRIWMPRQNLDFYVVSFPPASQLAIRHLEAFNIKLCGKLNYGIFFWYFFWYFFSSALTFFVFYYTIFSSFIFVVYFLRKTFKFLIFFTQCFPASNHLRIKVVCRNIVGKSKLWTRESGPK